ncbi:hypothetical protein CPC08DRAFT_710175, partial [Agrocybe pediades]
MDLLKNLQNIRLDDDKGNHHNDNGHTSQSTASSGTHSTASSLFNKIGDALNNNDRHSSQGSIPVPPPTQTPHKEENLFSKLGDALSGKQTPPPPTVATPAQHKEDNLLSKLGDALSGRKTPPPAPVAAPRKEENIFHKIGDAISGNQTPAQPAPTPQKQGFVGQLASVVTGKPQQKPPAKPAGLMDKINSTFGGGSKAEAGEDRLDKAIDMFQEHVLKQGPQDNESALEQAKDKQIADAIRKAAGMEKKD